MEQDFNTTLVMGVDVVFLSSPLLPCNPEVIQGSDLYSLGSV